MQIPIITEQGGSFTEQSRSANGPARRQIIGRIVAWFHRQE